MLPSQPHLHRPMAISLLLLTAALIVAALALDVLPMLWIIPAVSLLTLVHHATMWAMLRREPRQDQKLFSATSEIFAIFLTFAWISIVGICISMAVLIFTGHLKADKRGRWIVITLLVLSFLDVFSVGFISFEVHKERKAMLYRAKWQWRSDMPRSQWR